MKAVERKIVVVRRRVRVQRALDGATLAAVIAAAMACAGFFVVRIGWWTAAAIPILLTVGGGLVLLGAIFGALRPLASLDAARALDFANDLDDRISSAWFLTSRERGTRSPWVSLLVRDVERLVPRADVRRASPWRVPRDLRALVLGLAAAIASWALVFPTPEVAAVPVAPELYLEVPPSELALLAATAEHLRMEAERLGDEETRRAADELRKLWSDIATHEVNREEAFARLAAVEERLDVPGGSFDLIRTKLGALGKAMARDATLEDLGRALDREDFAAARDELEKLARMLEERELDAKEMRTLARTLDRGVKALARSKDLEKRADELRKDIDELERKEELTPDGERKLVRKKEELAALEEEMEELKEEGTMVERLSRDLEDLADMLRELDAGGASEKAQAAADKLGDMEVKLSRSETLEKLKRALAEGKLALVRGRSKQKSDGDEDRDGSGGEGLDGLEGEELEEALAELRLRAYLSRSGRHGPGSEEHPSPGSPGAEEPAGESDARKSDSAPIGPEPKERKPEGIGEEEDPGKGDFDPGAGADPEPMRGTPLGSAEFEDVDVPGKRGSGPVRSRVMLGAAKSGFAARGYEAIYDAVTAETEEVLEESHVPLGFRHYVRRYMEVIRPR